MLVLDEVLFVDFADVRVGGIDELGYSGFEALGEEDEGFTLGHSVVGFEPEDHFGEGDAECIFGWLFDAGRHDVRIVFDARPSHLFRHRGKFDFHRDGATGFDAAATADLAVALSGVHVTDVEEGSGMINGQVKFRPVGDFLDVEVTAPLPCPAVGSGLAFGCYADYSEHGFDGEGEFVVPDNPLIFDVDAADAELWADVGGSEVSGHCAGGSAISGPADGVGFDFADVDGEHLSGFGTFNVGAAGRCVASVGGLGVGSVGVVEVSDVVWDEFGVGAAVHLSLDFEPFAGFNAEGYGVGG